MGDSFDDNSKAGEVIAIFAKYLNNEKHIFTRQHILKMLVPFGNSFGKTHWKKCNKLAEGIISIQWAEKKHGFNQYVTPALIAVYIASNAQLKKWKDLLIDAINSPQAQVRCCCWSFLVSICILSKQSGSKLKSRGPKDVQLFINDEQIIELLKHTILNDKDKDVRDACAKFIYGAKKICSKISSLEDAYKQILKDKRASMALDIAADLFENDKNALIGNGDSSGNNEAALAKKVEAKRNKELKKQKASRKNNMRAMIAKARKEAAKQGGGGKIEVAASKKSTNKKEESSSDDEDSSSEDPPSKQKQKQQNKKTNMKRRCKQKIVIEKKNLT